MNEDEDVQMEKARVKEALSCRSCEEVGHFLGSICSIISSFRICVLLGVVYNHKLSSVMILCVYRV